MSYLYPIIYKTNSMVESYQDRRDSSHRTEPPMSEYHLALDLACTKGVRVGQTPGVPVLQVATIHFSA